MEREKRIYSGGLLEVDFFPFLTVEEKYRLSPKALDFLPKRKRNTINCRQQSGWCDL